MSALTLRDVTVVAGGVAILDSVSLDVRAGEVTAIVGPNGAGKTTLLNVVAGDVEPTAGEVTLDGLAVDRWRVDDLARRRAVLQQEQRLAFGFRVVDVVRMGRAPWARRPEEDLDDLIVADALRTSDVLHLADRTYPTLSGGEKSRTSFARVIAQSTDLVMLDEPTAALDIRHAERVLAQARALATAGHAVVAVLHDLTMAGSYADRIVLMSDGSVRADGLPADVLRPDLLAEVYEHPVDVISHGDRVVVVPHRLDTPEEARCVPSHSEQ